MFLLIVGMSHAGAAWAQDGVRLNSIEHASVGDGMEITLYTSARAFAGVSKTTDPLQIMVQLDSTVLGEVPGSVSVGNEWVTSISAEQLEDPAGVYTKVLIGLAQDVEYKASTVDDRVVIKLTALGGGDRDVEDDVIAVALEDVSDPEDLSSVRGVHRFGGGGNQIRGVDFKNFESTSRVIITGDSRVSYVNDGLANSQLTITLMDSRLGTGLERKLDTTRFSSAVQAVSSYQSRSRAGEVKVVVDLSEDIVPTIKELHDGTVLQIDFPVPDSVAAARQEVAPEYETWQSTMDKDEAKVIEEPKRLSSAYAEELVIGGDGLEDPSRSLGASNSIFGEEGVFLSPKPGHRYRGRKLNMDLVGADIHNVFRMISHVSKINIVASDNVKGTVTVRLTNVPWDQALAAILQAKGMGATQFGNIIRVAPIEVIKSEKEAALQAKKAEMDALPLIVLTIPLNYATAKDIQTVVKTVLSKRGKVTVDQRTNMLVVEDIRSAIHKVRELVKQLDRKTPEVLIEARIVEVNTRHERALGIQWGGHLNFSPASGAPTGVFFPNTIGLGGGRGNVGQNLRFDPVNPEPNWVVDLPATSPSGSMALKLGSIAGVIDLDARLSALEENGDGRIVSSPRLRTITNQEARVKQGSRVPFETVSVRGTVIQFVDAFLELKVTPHITSDRTVFLDVAIHKNRPDFSVQVNGNPVIDVKEVETLVMVRDGDTAVIGGVYTVEEQQSLNGLPGIMKVPVLGSLFRRKQSTTERKELIVFLTPKIIVDSAPMSGAASL